MVWIMWAALIGRYILLAWLCVYVVQTEGRLGALLDRVRGAGARLGAGARHRRPAAISGSRAAPGRRCSRHLRRGPGSRR